MSAQDLEQRARELLAAEYERDGKAGSADHIRTQPLLPNKARAVRAIVAALRQQPAPVDLEQFREAVNAYGRHEVHDAATAAYHYRLLSSMRNAGKVAHQPAPAVDDTDATDILALSLDEFGHHTEAKNVRAGEDLDEYRIEMWAIRAALARAQGEPK